ncbi:uncharacterized protein LOC132198839 [Neocloeon triangulifer]|uniref:uncharacterized protein LOC132198839 n=1 Tax=Neocloeon triangulifer TaxID=2078957 RepID=UPI00286F35C3|nr:uncharacterized protein LOC132198839 [Neocloeon triangulifer]
MFGRRVLDFSVILAALVAVAAAGRHSLGGREAPLVQSWAEAARKWFFASFSAAEGKAAEDISAAFGLFNLEMARRVSRMPRAEMRVYAAVADDGDALNATLPDGRMSRSGSHHGVLLLDPFPAARFGHPVLMFFIDRGISEKRCNTIGGKRLESGECLQVARKNRCPNLMAAERMGGQNNRMPRHRVHMHVRCAINFIPLVRSAKEAPVRTNQRGGSVGTPEWEQRLTCRDDIPGFNNACPALRDAESTRLVECDPLRLNSQRCDFTHEAAKTKCNIFQTCDHAVLLSGGWNRQMSDSQSLINTLAFYEMLKRNGFSEENIKVFFANGLPADQSRPHMYSAVMKFSLRHHLRTLCETKYCADSLVIYLNSPTRSDGSPLLWDLDNNGEADTNEVYTVREMLRDIQGCLSRRVIMVIDQSYSGEILKAIHNANNLSNVIVFTSGTGHQPAWQGDFTAHWSRAMHRNTCLHQIYEDSLKEVTRSSPSLRDTTSGEATRTTLTGAPCGAYGRPSSDEEARQQYEGCQNLPSSIYLSSVYG